jgi:tetratricopeptide (TPR) repeat protein
MKTIELLQKGLEEHHAGRLDAAAAAYAAALEAEPANVSALRCLGVLRSQQNDLTAALSLLQAAANLAPDMPEVYNDLGSVLRLMGAYEEALRAFNEALRLHPLFAEAFFNRGLTFEALGDVDRALDSYEKAVQSDASRHEARYNKAAILYRRGDHVRAIPELRTILDQHEGALEAGLLLGRIYRETGNWSDAERLYRSMHARHPRNEEVLLHLGSCRLVLQRYDQAERSLLDALQLNPGNAEAHYKVGVAQLHLSQVADAAAHLRQAAAVRPDHPDVALQYAIALQRAGFLYEAGNAYALAVALAPENADAHWNHADYLLLQGRYPEGWAEFEWRWKHERFLTPDWKFTSPRWNGESIRGKTILLHPEQGFGDMIQFARYVPTVAALGARVLIGTPPELEKVFAESFPPEDIFTSPKQLPPFDVHCPLMSLPRIFRTDVGTIPAAVPYLRVNEAAARPWREYFALFPGKLKVGIIWSGNPGQEHNKHRACRLEDFAPILGEGGVQFFSLQKGAPATQLQESRFSASIIDIAPRLSDFAETAAAMEQMDLIISTDTGPVHLAGALARPTWLLLSAIPDWRWMVDRADSPWYPTIRLYRQKKVGDWTEVIHHVAHELGTIALDQRRTLTPGGSS